MASFVAIPFLKLLMVTSADRCLHASRKSEQGTCPAIFYVCLQAPTEYSSATTASACEDIGFMLDGGKLKGYCQLKGVQLKSCYVITTDATGAYEDDYYFDWTAFNAGDCHLDMCNYSSLKSAYVLSADYPFVPPCLWGTVGTIYGFTPTEK
jgi:hypothetical protein